MRTPHSARALVLVLLLGSCCLAAPSAPAGAAERVVIVVLDGLRATEGFDDPAFRYIPHMGLELAPQGALARACDNMGMTLTIPGHSAIASGRYQNLPDDGTVRPYLPLLWEYYRSATGASDGSVSIVTTKSKIRCLTYSTYASYGSADSARAIGPTWDDAATVQEFLNDMVVYRPAVAFLNLGEIDGQAHTGNWNAYTRAIVKADSVVAILWHGIQADPVYRGRTTLIITGDHGRHTDGYGDWSEHGDGCPGCRRIPLLALGPDFAAGVVSWTPCQQTDILKTVASTIGLAVPLAGGRVLTELLQGAASVRTADASDGHLRIEIQGSSARFTAPPVAGTVSIFDAGGRNIGSRDLAGRATWTWQGPASGIFLYRFTPMGSYPPQHSGRLILLR